jgi:hypothetical protein
MASCRIILHSRARFLDSLFFSSRGEEKIHQGKN